MSKKTDSRSSNALASLAFLEAAIDSGTDVNKTDRLGLFMPFVEDSVLQLYGVKFKITDVVDKIVSRCGIGLPSPVVEGLLRRLAKSGYIKRANGFYEHTSKPMETADVSAALHKINGDLTKLINDMGRYARKQEKKKYSNSTCRKDLIAYFEDHLDSLSTRELVVNEAECKATKWVGRYLLWAKQNNETSFNAAVKLVRGHIVYEAAFLPGFASNTQSLEGTVLYLDSPTVCRALGYGTEEEERLVNEAISMLQRAGAELRVFDLTIEEMTRVLSGVVDRWDDLSRFDRPSSYDMNLRRRGYSKADVVRISSDPSYVVETELHFQVDETPSRKFLYVYDEETLIKYLQRPEGCDAELAIMHDVNCIAAILTLREKLTAKSFKTARYFFVTTSMMTVRQSTKWWNKTESPTILPPIYSLTKMANLAWLYSDPTSAKRYGEKALLSACAAAAIPSDHVWKSFAEKLLKYNKEGKISREDAVHYLYSMDTRKVLAVKEDARDDDHIGTFDFDDIIDEAEVVYRSNIRDQEIDSIRGENARLSKELSEIRTVNEELQGQSKSLSVELDRKSKRVRTIAKKAATIIVVLCVAFFTLLLVYLVHAQCKLGIAAVPGILVTIILESVSVIGALPPKRQKLAEWIEKKLFRS